MSTHISTYRTFTFLPVFNKLNFIFLSFLIVFYTSSSAQTFTVLPTNTADLLTNVFYASNSIAYITGEGPNLMKSNDGGNSFLDLSTAFLPANSKLSSCYFLSVDTGYIAGGTLNGSNYQGFVYKTNDGGSTWSSIVSGLPSMINSIHFPSSQIGYIIGGVNNSGIIYKTTNGGTTWNSIYNSQTFTNWLPNAFFFNSDNGIVVGNDGVFDEAKLIKIGGGIVSSNLNNSTYVYFTDVYFKSVDTGFVTCSDFSGIHILKTTNQGASWTNVYNNANPNDILYSLTFSDNQKGFAVGNNGFILMTSNGGNSWSNVSSPTVESLRDISFANPIHGTIVGANSTILKVSICTGNASSSTLTETACSEYLFNNMIYNTSGTYTQVLTNAVGCDSTITLNLTVHQPSSGLLNLTNCGPLTINNEVYISSGTFEQNLQNVKGCDSTLTLNITINEIDTAVIQNGTELMSNQTGASYQWLTCPAFTVIPGATSQTYTASGNGNYAVQVMYNNCIDTSMCFEVNSVGITSSTLPILQIYPNPTQGRLHVQVSQTLEDATLRIFNITGQLISQSEHIKGLEFETTLHDQPNGLYFIHLMDGEHQLIDKFQIQH
jgi:photosystem II stability/assembly factor-like uncharacterized protein